LTLTIQYKFNTPDIAMLSKDSNGAFDVGFLDVDYVLEATSFSL